MYSNPLYGQHRSSKYDADGNMDAFTRNEYFDGGRIAHDNYASSRPYQSDVLSQAAVGRARLSLPPPEIRGHEPEDPWLRAPAATEQVPYARTQLVHKHAVFQHENSSSPGDALSSSPAFQASQRQQNSDLLMPIRLQAPNMSQQKSSGSDKRPTVHGIQLVPVHTLPDRFRAIFPFALFNAVQSACFESIYGSDDNCVFSSPTGSGKTVLFEIAICRLLRNRQNGSFKVVYMAPTKSLCSERVRDWKAKFGPLNLSCEEMTGDTESSSLQHVQKADIIVTTPEKWDSMTRRWKDHEKLVRLIKLLLIDEVHILNKDRGAALEVVISRMKSIGSGTRSVALSATVPNSQDIATWLGKDDTDPTLPATHMRFGEEFRPVTLKRHVCGFQSNANPFGFDTILTKKLPEVISRYSQKKPIMVFCFTRKSCSEAAKFLAQWWQTSLSQNRFWSAPKREIKVEDKSLQDIVSAGVAVHHAGLSQDDRSTIERAYLAGELSVICCTSTLAVGVNLPCHMVIIKNTVSYEAGAVKEYSDLEVMQMIGRAGRPQFDSSALAVIMTRFTQVKHYEQMLSGQEELESCLHLNLVEHLNAEIGLGMIADLQGAKKWLAGTFLRRRLEANPTHYQIPGDSPSRNLNARLEQICANSIPQLERLALIVTDPEFKTTECGEAMARYYMNISTMESVLSLPHKPKISELLSVISQAYEFRELRFRSGEKQVYKELNDEPNIRFPVKVDLSTAAHKVSLVIQSVLGGIGRLADQQNYRTQYITDQAIIFQHVHRLIRCIVDCQNCRKDLVGIRNSLMLSRSLAARVWDDSPMVLQQIEQIGPVTLRKLVSAKITTIEELAGTEPGRIELIINKLPPFGWNILKRVQLFPKLRVSLQMFGEPTIKPRESVLAKMKVDIGFLNEKTPIFYRSKPVYIIVLIGTSDGQRVSFLRASAQKLDRINPITVTATLTSPTQLIECYAMCDELAGTMQQAILKPDIPASAFQSIRDLTTELGDNRHATRPSHGLDALNNPVSLSKDTENEEWDDGGLEDDDFMHAEPTGDGFVDIDELNKETPMRLGQPNDLNVKGKAGLEPTTEHSEDQRLENGNFACNHACRDKSVCKHACCKEGLKKKPKPRKPKEKEASSTNKRPTAVSLSTKTQSRLDHFTRQVVPADSVEHVDLSQTLNMPSNKTPLAAKKLARLHSKTTQSGEIPLVGKATEKPTYSGFVDSHRGPRSVDVTRSNSFEEHVNNEMLLTDSLPTLRENWGDRLLTNEDEYLDEDEDMLDAALVGLEDSQELRSEDADVVVNRGSEGQNTFSMETDKIRYEQDGASSLFVTPQASQYKASSDNYDEQGDDQTPTEAPSGVKREREEMVPSGYFSGKRTKKEDDEGEAEEEKLRAWLAAELGDSVEMI